MSIDKSIFTIKKIYFSFFKKNQALCTAKYALCYAWCVFLTQQKTASVGGCVSNSLRNLSLGKFAKFTSIYKPLAESI